MAKSIDGNTSIGDVLHQWTILEYEKHERGTLWHILMLSTGIALVVYGLLSDNFLFALIIILFSIIMFLQANQEPQQISFGITELGVIVGNRFYAYSEFESFHIIYQPPSVKTLFFETRSVFRPTLRVPLLDVNPVDIRFTLSEYISEDLTKEEEPLSDTAVRNWKIH